MKKDKCKGCPYSITLLAIFALLGVFLTFSENENVVITGIVIVSFCALIYLVMFVLHCVWNRKSNKQNKDEFDTWKKAEKEKVEKKYQYLNTLEYKADRDGTMPLINLRDRALTDKEYEFVDVYKGER